MLQIGIHDGDEGRTGREDAFDAGAGQTAPADPPQATHPRVFFREFLYGSGRAVGRIVIDKDHLPGDAGKHRIQFSGQGGDIVPFLEGWDNHGKFRGNGRCRPVS